MAIASSKSNPTAPGTRKRVEVETSSLKRARNGSAFTRCEECNKDVPVVLIDMHSCSLDSKIKMNLEAHDVERVTEAKKPAQRAKGESVGSKTKRNKKASSPAPKTKKNKKVKDPNMPKRPPTAFFAFMDDFRKSFKEANPDNKSVSVVAKEGGEKWKSMTEEEKKPYLDKVAELKAEYDKAMEKFNSEDAQEQEGSEKEEE